MQQYSCPDKSVEEIETLIDEWNTKQYNGRYSEKFAVLNDGGIVVMMFLYQHTTEVISIEHEIFPDYRKRGFGKEALSLV